MFLMNRELMTTLILDCRMQMSFMLCLKFLSLIQPSLWESLRSPTSNICLLKPGTQSLVVNFPAHWLLIVTVDTPLSGWDGTGKSIALCWLRTDFPVDQNALIDDGSCGGSLSILLAPVMDALVTPQQQFLYQIHPSCPEWVQGTPQWARGFGGPYPKFGFQMLEPIVSALPPSPVH